MNSLYAAVLLAATVLVPAMCQAQDGAQGSADQEPPPVVYTLEIDGQSIQLTPDSATTIEGKFTNPTFTLRVANVRTLQAAGVRFDYPAYFTYEADTSDPSIGMWTIEGRDVTLMLFNFGEQVDPQDLAQSTAESLQATNLKSEPVKLRLGEKECSGVKATFQLGGASVIQQVLTLPPTSRGSRLLTIQEVRDEGEGESPELGATLKLVASSMKVAGDSADK